MAIERSELRLLWPPALFAAEAERLLAFGASSDADLGWLMDEAFHRDRGFKYYLQVSAGDPFRQMFAPLAVHAGQPRPELTGVALVRDLADQADALTPYTPPQYYSARQRRAPHRPAALSVEQVKAEYAGLVAALDQTGYFEDAFGSACTDAREDPDTEGQSVLGDLLNTEEALWPLTRPVMSPGIEAAWEESLFYDMVEALHDHIARPRTRTWHPFADEWDYSDHDAAAGRAVYRWQVNTLLARSVVPLRLAADGEDAGRLVRVAGDDRDELVDRALASPDPGAREDITHAVALSRARTATVAERRSAAVALAGILEARRPLLKDKLTRKDEGALFHIANEFAIRHRDARQHGDYDPVFLDWTFWIYLATVELTDRLLERPAGTS